MGAIHLGVMELERDGQIVTETLLRSCSLQDHLGGATEFNSQLEGCPLWANYYVFPEDYQI